jgi:TatD DNase family protein
VGHPIRQAGGAGQHEVPVPDPHQFISIATVNAFALVLKFYYRNAKKRGAARCAALSVLKCRPLWEWLPAFVANPAVAAGAAMAESAHRSSRPSPKATAAMRCRSHRKTYNFLGSLLPRGFLELPHRTGTDMDLFDSHCHLDDTSYAGDRETVFERARAVGVSRLMAIGVTLGTSRAAVDLAKTHPGVYASVGVHPHDAQECSDDVLASLVSLARNPEVRAWGEIGLDFNRMYSPRDEQEKWFVRQLETAVELGLPLIFHERDSGGRFLALLRTCPPPAGAAVIHCFSGNRAELTNYLDLGYYIGITGIVTLKERGESLRRLIPQIPANRLVVETDAPYLTPEPERRRHRRNEPAFVRSVLIKIAEVRGEDPDELARTVFDNTCRLYRIEALV